MYNFLNSLFMNYTYQQGTFFGKQGYTFHTASTVSLKLCTPHVMYEKKINNFNIVPPPPPAFQNNCRPYLQYHKIMISPVKIIFTIFHSRALHGLSVKFWIKNFFGYKIQWHSGKVPL